MSVGNMILIPTTEARTRNLDGPHINILPVRVKKKKKRGRSGGRAETEIQEARIISRTSDDNNNISHKAVNASKD